MTPEQLRDACLALLGTSEEWPFREPSPTVFKVGGKIFAISRLDAEPLTVSLKCDPELAVELRASHPEIQPGYHLNKRHWNTVRLDGGLPDELVLSMIEDSYDLVVDGLPRSRRPVRRRG
jgi:predicted DNA-binding protein (MmcQ/YjbR family)